jgi:hypothetical protein
MTSAARLLFFFICAYLRVSASICVYLMDLAITLGLAVQGLDGYPDTQGDADW